MNDLAARFRAHVRSRGWVESGDAILVALSGGLDSTVLLHLLRFAPPARRLNLHAVHVDHGMRPGSANDALFVGGLCAAWQVALRLARLDPGATSETEARERRYEVLEQARLATGARWVLTAHHADDQAETVLFRIVRGTGIKGLSGIPEHRDPGVLRPLLPFRRAELQEYSDRHRIRVRADPSNEDLVMARNRLRHEVIPALERHVAPGTRTSLVRLARHARDLEQAVLQWVGGLAVETSTDGAMDTTTRLDRARLLGMPTELRAIVLRAAFQRSGWTLGESGTRSVIEFTSNCSSGSQFSLGPVEVRREFETFVVTQKDEPSTDSSLIVEVPGEGGGEVQVGGRRYRARWSVLARPSLTHVDSFPQDRVRFPLEIRPWRPGDRIRMTYGTKKLVKLFAEKRLGTAARRAAPLLVDADGQVLWAPGIARADVPESGRSLLYVGIGDAEES